MKALEMLVLLCTTVITLACNVDDTLPTPKPNAVSPSEDTGSRAIELTIKGEGFMILPVRQLSRGAEFKTQDAFQISLFGKTTAGKGKKVVLQNAKYIDNETLKGTLPEGMPEGTYGVEVMSPNGKTGRKKNLFRVVKVSGETDTETETETGTDPPTKTPLFDDTDFEIDDAEYLCETNDTCDDTCSGSLCRFGCKSSRSCDYTCWAEQCGMVCNGTGSCELGCSSEKCELACLGAGQCAMACNSGACKAANIGVGEMTVFCNSSSCDIDCTGPGACIVTCEDTNSCHINCSADTERCGDQIYACNTSCP